MSTSDKDKIAEYSADYRNAHPPTPKAEEPHQKSKQGKPNHPVQSRQKAANRPRPKPEPVRKAPRAAAPDRMENDSEIDDFLPAKDSIDGDQILTKWDNETTERSVIAAPRENTHRRAGRYPYGIFVGSLVLILALVGVVFIAMGVGTRIHSALTDDSKLRAYDKFLTVAVAQDPQPFASPDKADPDFVLNASLWQTMSENHSSYTSYDDAGRTIVPLGDVADACRELFGPKCSLQPKNPTTETFYTYDSAKSQFHISLYSLESTYEPYTVNSKWDGDSTVLRVGYIPPSDPTRASSAVSSSTAKPTPTKYMDYVLKTDPSTKKEYIYAVRKAA